MRSTLTVCLRDPIPEIADAARYLDAAVSAHMAGKSALADQLIRLADMPAITEWTESLWGKGGEFSRRMAVADPLPFVSRDRRAKARMPSRALIMDLFARDGFYCRFFGISLGRAETRA